MKLTEQERQIVVKALQIAADQAEVQAKALERASRTGWTKEAEQFYDQRSKFLATFDRVYSPQEVET